MTEDCGGPLQGPAPEPCVPAAGSTVLHPLSVAFPDLTSADCCQLLPGWGTVGALNYNL